MPTDPKLRQLLADVKQALAQATPGPWTEEPHGDTTALYSGRSDGDGDPFKATHGLRLMNLDDGDRNFPANAHLIAHAPEWLAALLAAVEQVEQERDRLRLERNKATASLQEHLRVIVGWKQQYEKLQALCAELDEAVTEALKDRDYFSEQLTRAEARVTELEAVLRAKDMAYAEAMALVLSHEVHIEKLEAERARVLEVLADATPPPVGGVSVGNWSLRTPREIREALQAALTTPLTGDPS